MNILSNKIEVSKKFAAVLRCQYERRTRHPIDFFAVFLLKPKVIELLRMSCGKNVLVISKNTNADQHWSVNRRLGTSEIENVKLTLSFLNTRKTSISATWCSIFRLAGQNFKIKRKNIRRNTVTGK